AMRSVHGDVAGHAVDWLRGDAGPDPFRPESFWRLPAFGCGPTVRCHHHRMPRKSSWTGCVFSLARGFERTRRGETPAVSQRSLFNRCAVVVEYHVGTVPWREPFIEIGVVRGPHARPKRVVIQSG